MQSATPLFPVGELHLWGWASKFLESFAIITVPVPSQGTRGGAFCAGETEMQLLCPSPLPVAFLLRQDVYLGIQPGSKGGPRMRTQGLSVVLSSGSYQDLSVSATGSIYQCSLNNPASPMCVQRLPKQKQSCLVLNVPQKWCLSIKICKQVLVSGTMMKR